MTHVCMVAYTLYSSDQRVRREAEAVASIPGHRVTVLVLKERDVPRTVEKAGVVIKELDISKYRGKSGVAYLLSYVRFTILAFFECNRLLAREALDVVHAHNMPNFLVFAGMAPFIAGKPVILDVHDTMVETYAAKFSGRSSRLLRWALRLEEVVCCRIARRIVCVHDIQKAAMVGRGIPEAKIVVAMNVPDPRLFDHNKASRSRVDARGNLRMVYHGTVTKRVGVDQAIRAVSKLNGKIPGLEFHIIGDGDDLKEFQAISEELGQQDRVRFLGRVPLEGLIPILDEMDLGIIPNGRNQATELMLPVKMLECIALGIPVVAPRLKTILHFFTDDMLFFFEPDDVESMSEAILAASVSAEERLQKARAATRFLKTYGWESHRSAFMEMYRDIVASDVRRRPRPERNGQCQ